MCVFFLYIRYVCDCSFTVAANAYELNNLDNDALDAPIFTMTSAGTMAMSNTGKHQTINGAVLDRPSTISDFASLPCQSVLVACKKSESADGVGLFGADGECGMGGEREFEQRNHPIYQSAHAQSMRGQCPMERQMMDNETGGADCVDGGGCRNGGKYFDVLLFFF